MSLARRLRKRAEEVDKAVIRVLQEMAGAIHQQLIVSTPVDTGKARSNWLITIENPTNLVVEPRSPAEAVAGGKIALKEVNSPDDTIYISNNVHYVIKLNEGFSPQQPEPGFVERAVEVGRLRAWQIKVFK